jgi:hypothetical protein
VAWLGGRRGVRSGRLAKLLVVGGGESAEVVGAAPLLGSVGLHCGATGLRAVGVSPFLAWIGSPCLSRRVHGASIGGGRAAPRPGAGVEAGCRCRGAADGARDAGGCFGRTGSANEPAQPWRRC